MSFYSPYSPKPDYGGGIQDLIQQFMQIMFMQKMMQQGQQGQQGQQPQGQYPMGMGHMQGAPPALPMMGQNPYRRQ